MNREEREELERASMCGHPRLHASYTQRVQQLELLCETCDTLLIYTLNDLREIMCRNLLRRLEDANDPRSN